MGISAELELQIEAEKAALIDSDIRRSGHTASDFADILTKLFANAKSDQQQLVDAGMSATYLEYCDALLQKLSKDLAFRYGTSTEKPDERLYFEQQYSAIQKDRRYMLAVVSHIVERCGDKKIKQNYKHIVKGSSIIDSLHDCLALAVIIKKYPDFAAEIRPKGMTIDAAYCTLVENKAAELLKLKGYVVDNDLTPTDEVNQLNRIITLCVNAQSQLKKFAYAAFIDESEHYERFYVFSSGSKTNDENTSVSQMATTASN
jgi:hypothetical protein